MNSSKFRFTLDLHSIQSQYSIPVMLGDTSVTWLISLTDGGVPFIINDGCIAKLSIKRPTGTYLEEFCKIRNNAIIEYPFRQNKNTCAVEGIHHCDVTLYDPDGEVLGGPRFIMVVNEKVVRRDDIVLTDEDWRAVDGIIAAEANRITAEEERVTAEEGRATAEEERDKAEKARVAAEEERATAEEKRAEAEETRVEAETARVTAEEKRTIAIEKVIKRAEEASERAENVASDGATFTPDVSDDGVISWTNNKGLDNPEPINIKGPQGERGLQGEQGVQGIQGVKGDTGAKGDKGDTGARGEKGDPFSIAKIYSSVAAMNAGYSSDGVAVGSFVVIDTGNVDDDENARLYIKGESAYTFLTDLSGTQGIKGEKGDKGDKGDKGEKGDTGAKGEQGVQGLQGIQGEKGDKGDKGDQGDDAVTLGLIAPGTNEYNDNPCVVVMPSAGNKSTSEYAYSEGFETTASGARSHSEGYKTNATGDNSHAEGQGTTASGSSSHAEGVDTVASGNYSHSEGWYTEASGRSSHAGGIQSYAEGKNSFAHGDRVKAAEDNQFAVGKYNADNAEALFMVGNGTSDTARSNAFEVISNSEGAAIKVGNTTCTEAQLSSIASGTNEGNDVSALIALGTNTANDNPCVVIMPSAGNKSTAEYAYSEGSNTTASGRYSHAEGAYTSASGSCSHAEGLNSHAKGDKSHAQGEGCNAQGLCSHAGGINSTASGYYSFAHGYRVNAYDNNQTVFGMCNKKNAEALFIIGNGSTTEPSNAFEVLKNGAIAIDGVVLSAAGITDMRNSIAKNAKRIAYVKNGIPDDIFETDSTYAYKKAVPVNVNEYAEIESVDTSVTEVRSLSGNKVLGKDVTVTNSIRDGKLTVTDLGEGKFQFDGYTSSVPMGEDREPHPNPSATATTRVKMYTFLTIPVTPGSYTVNKTFISENTANDYTETGCVLVNNAEYNYGVPIIVTESTNMELKIGVECGMTSSGMDKAVYKFSVMVFEMDQTNLVQNYTNLQTSIANGNLIASYTSDGTFTFTGYNGNEYSEVADISLEAGTYACTIETFTGTPMNLVSIGISYNDNVVSILADGLLSENSTDGANGNSRTVLINVSNTAVAKLLIQIDAGAMGNGMTNYRVKYTINKLTGRVIDSLSAPIEGEIIAVEPEGTLVFVNPDNAPVSSTVTYMLKGV